MQFMGEGNNLEKRDAGSVKGATELDGLRDASTHRG